MQETPWRLADLLRCPLADFPFEREPALSTGEADFIVKRGDQTYVVECKSSGQAAPVLIAARQVRKHAAALGHKAIPLVAVPFMGEVGKRLCAEEGVSWLDLSGNAHIHAPGLRIEIDGKPNRFKRVGRPRSLFAPKSARITRWLLMRHGQTFSQRELSRLSGLDEGFTSRIVRGLEHDGLITRDASGAVRVADYHALLAAWREAYDFSGHHIVRGHVAARSSDAVLRQLAKTCQSEHLEYAATGLAAAWLWSGHAGFRLVVLFVATMPDAEARSRMGFHEIPRGENVWLVRPDDAGVFQGSELRAEIRCVHPVQVYLDLKDQPERSAEAAEALRKQLLNSPPNA